MDSLTFVCMVFVIHMPRPAIHSGDDIKTVQGNLDHATAAFTLDVYGHLTDQMKQTSAERMERYIHSVSDW